MHLSAHGAVAARDLDRVRRLLPSALLRLQRYGLVWQHPVTIDVHSEPSTFIRATGQTVPTLRAWSTWQRVDLLATDTWSRATDVDVEQRLTHELCHLGSWHRATTEARARMLPRFVSEGVCSVVADQQRLRLDAATVHNDLDNGRAIDFTNDSPFAYAVAHHVVAGLVVCRGASAVTTLLDAIYDGVDVDVALGSPAGTLVEAATSGHCGP